MTSKTNNVAVDELVQKVLNEHESQEYCNYEQFLKQFISYVAPEETDNDRIEALLVHRVRTDFAIEPIVEAFMNRESTGNGVSIIEPRVSVGHKKFGKDVWSWQDFYCDTNVVAYKLPFDSWGNRFQNHRKWR